MGAHSQQQEGGASSTSRLRQRLAAPMGGKVLAGAVAGPAQQLISAARDLLKRRLAALLGAVDALETHGEAGIEPPLQALIG